MPNVDIDLGDAPYLVALHQDDDLRFEPAKIDEKGHGVLQELKFDPPLRSPSGRSKVAGSPGSATSSSSAMRSATAGMREVEFAQNVKPIKKGGLIVSSLRGFGFGTPNEPVNLEKSIIRGTDIPIKESMAFTFAVRFPLSAIRPRLHMIDYRDPLSGPVFLPYKHIQ